MVARALVTLAVAMLAWPAGAQGGGVPWHAVVTAPRQSFPTVTIDLGYPGPYVPWQNAPITLRATARDYPFDGYIGFHFRVNDHLTYDTPVISRAVLRPHEQWTFTTFARLRRFGGVGDRPLPREVAVEWRDRAMRRAAVVSAGVPPWTLWMEPLRPLLVAGSEGKPVLGRNAFVERAAALSDQARWYAGFSDVVLPLATWLDLPRRVREAIFGSGVHMVLFGFARPDQRLDEIGRALLPVTFTAKAGSYDAPWPYRRSRTMPVATSLSWTVNEGTWAVGRGPLPYLVQNSVAAWSADEIGISQPLPATVPTPTRLREAVRRSSVYDPKAKAQTIWPGPVQLLRMFPAPALSIAALIVSLSAWMFTRKRIRAAVMIAMLLLTGFILAARDRIRPPAAGYDIDIRTPLSAGIIRHLHFRRTYGPAPIPAQSLDAQQWRTSMTGADDWYREAEIRTSDTPVGMGTIVGRRDWDAISRWSVRRETGRPPVIRIRKRDAKEIVFEYESPVPINYIYATWLAGSSFHAGGTPIRERRSGTVTIAQGSDVPEESEVWPWGIPGLTQREYSDVAVALAQKDRQGVQWLNWYERPAMGKSFVVAAGATREGDGSCTWTFALPPETSPDASATVTVFDDSRSNPVSIEWAGGTSVLQPAAGPEIQFGSRSYSVPPAILQQILAGGGIVKVGLKGNQPTDPRAWIAIREKKS